MIYIWMIIIIVSICSALYSNYAYKAGIKDPRFHITLAMIVGIINILIYRGLT